MRFAMFKGEKSVTDLATRLFGLQGRGSQAVTMQAADALLKANPQLKDISKVAPGSIIAIPDTAPQVVPAEAAITVGLSRSFAAQSLQNRLDSLHKRLSDIESSALDQVNSLTSRLQTVNLKAALTAAADENIAFLGQAPNVDNIAKDARDIVRNVETVQDARKQAISQLSMAVTRFAKKWSG